MTASSPTFVAKFADGTVTRMTTFCEPGEGQRPETFEWLDLQRGIALSHIAYESRKKKETAGIH